MVVVGEEREGRLPHYDPLSSPSLMLAHLYSQNSYVRIEGTWMIAENSTVIQVLSMQYHTLFVVVLLRR